MTKPRQRSSSERGFALLVVLWAMVLLAMLATEITMTGRSEAQLAANIRDNAIAEAQADGLVYESIFRLLDQSALRWRPDDVPHEIRLAQGVAEVRLESLDGLIGLNVASAALLQQLLQRLGVGPGRAAALAAAIVDWRTSNLVPTFHGAKLAEYRAAGLSYGPPDAPFRSKAELAYVLGMTPELLARLKPNVSVFQEGDPVLDFAPPAVVEAVTDLDGGHAALPSTTGVLTRPAVVQITVNITESDGARYDRRAVVRLSPDAIPTGGRPYQILAWDSGGS